MKHKNLVFFILIQFAFAVLAHAGQTDKVKNNLNNSIEALSTKLSKSNGLWTNGTFKPILLSENATDEQIIKQFVKNIVDEEHKLTKHKILKSQQINISSQEYRAVLLDTNLGRKIIFMKFYSPKSWWTKIFDADDVVSEAKPNAGKTTGQSAKEEPQ